MNRYIHADRESDVINLAESDESFFFGMIITPYSNIAAPHIFEYRQTRPLVKERAPIFEYGVDLPQAESVACGAILTTGGW